MRGNLLGEWRRTGWQCLRQVAGRAPRSRARLIGGFPLRLLYLGWDGRAHRAIANDLAKGADRSQILRDVQVGSTRVRNLADSGNFRMVVEDFGKEEVEFTGEQHTYHQGIGPIATSMFYGVVQANRRAPSGFRPKLSAILHPS